MKGYSFYYPSFMNEKKIFEKEDFGKTGILWCDRKRTLNDQTKKTGQTGNKKKQRMQSDKQIHFGTGVFWNFTDIN